jgi:ribosome maturation factor RimP
MMTSSLQNHAAPEAKLTAFLESKLSELQYELVAIEILNHREKKLRIYIDHQKSAADQEYRGVGIDDCVKVTHELDAPLEASPEVIAIFKGEYELEVSSPGLDRPLRKPSDYEKFVGQIVRLTTFRPLNGDETKAPEYSAKNPKQKKFYGLSRGFEAETASILFGIVPEDGTGKKPRAETLIRIPLELVAKANLEPEIEIPDSDED